MPRPSRFPRPSARPRPGSCRCGAPPGSAEDGHPGRFPTSFRCRDQPLGRRAGQKQPGNAQAVHLADRQPECPQRHAIADLGESSQAFSH
ncbi:MAG: hypothetical protein ACK559_09895, partial [bacterium]